MRLARFMKVITDSSTQPTLKFLITGATGFVSQCVAASALERGFTVAQVSKPWGDIVSQIRLEKPDVIFHGAGSASVAHSITDPVADREASVGTWSRLLEAVTLSGVKPLILFPSSAAVYGNPSSLPVHESAPRNPISPYGEHKVMCEDLAESYRKSQGLDIVVFRLFSLFGAGQKRLLVRELFERAVSPQDEVVLQGTGYETRDYLSQDDFGHAVVDFARHRLECGAKWKLPDVLNLASGVETSVRDIAELIVNRLEFRKPVVCHGQTRPGDPGRWVADVSAFRALCPDWSPLPLETSLTQTLASWVAEEGKS